MPWSVQGCREKQVDKKVFSRGAPWAPGYGFSLPIAKSLKKTITINLDENIIGYFKQESDNVGVPYQTLINMYLNDCMKNKRHIKMI